MIFYVLLALSVLGLFLFSYRYPYAEKNISLILFGIMVFVSGLRNRVGGDYDSYVSWYLLKTRDNRLEFGFVAIMDLFRWLKLSPQFLFFFFSFFTCYFVFLGVKKYSENSNLALLLYILLPSLYLSSLVFVRQSFSVAISFYAFYYLINKRYLIYFVLMFIGISIHNSCLIPFVVFLLIATFIDTIKIKHLIFLLIISLILSMFDFIRIFSVLFKETRYAFYFSNQRIPVNNLKLIILNCVSIFVLFHFDKLKETYAYQKYILILYVFSVVLINVFSPLNELSRIYIYFRIFEIIVVADLIFLASNQKRILFFSFFFVLYFGSFLNALKKDFESRENMCKFIPYNNILWSSNDDSKEH